MNSPPTPSKEVWNELADRAALGIVRNGQRYRSEARKRSIKWQILVGLLLAASAAVAYRHWPAVERIADEVLRRIRSEYASLTQSADDKPKLPQAPAKFQD
ncbi:MAG: hypothetical protein O3C60_12760 [Planctomycetota bacterium]|nr:hypothetical protein [Planctomycetota bacterium]